MDSLNDSEKNAEKDSEKDSVKDFNADNVELQNFLLVCLMSHTLEPKDYQYFGYHVLPLACEWMNAQVPKFGEAAGVYGKPALSHIPEAYLIMLGGSSCSCVMQ